MEEIKRGDMYYADLNPVEGCEQGGIRPVLVIQNDVGNKFSRTTIVAAITSRKKRGLPTHVEVEEQGLQRNSVVLLEQIRTIDKNRLLSYIGGVSIETMERIDEAMEISLGLAFRGGQNYEQITRQEECNVLLQR